MSFDKRVENDQVVSSLVATTESLKNNMRAFCGLMRRVVKEDMWRERVLTQALARTGEVVTFDYFDEFIEAMSPDGLGLDVDELTRLAEDLVDVLQLVSDVPPLDEEDDIYVLHWRRGLLGDEQS